MTTSELDQPGEASATTQASGESSAATTTSRTCPYCLEPVHARALKCKHCLSYLGERGRRQALQEVLTSMGFRSVQVGQPGVFGLSLPGAALLFIGLYYGAKGLFAILGSQPALLQVVIGVIGVLIAVAFFRAR